MDRRSTMPLIAAAALAALTACSKPGNTLESKTQVTTTSPQGQVESTKVSKQVGDTLETKTETKSNTDEATVKTTRDARQVGNSLEVRTETETRSKTDAGTVKTTTSTFIGTVTVYQAGKKIEVLTGEKTRHAISLDAKDLQVSVAGKVAVGAHVRLVEETGELGTRVSVTVVH
jgi:hypothetical protein